ncbi:MAG TPA: sulfatase-like hydrolase/transferase [archaeon]|nr:sulfatase-like hydrolase/transferase [archaeon]
MDRRDFLKLGGAAVGLPALLKTAACVRGHARIPEHPNILFICVDQFNAGCAGFAGHPLVYTPNLDRLASRGTVFTACYSNSPVCVPARAAMFTGLYPHEVEAYDNAAPFDGRVPAWTNRLNDSGYLCRAAGKLDFLYHHDYGMQEIDTVHGHDTSPDITAYFRNPIVPRVDSRAQIDAFLDETPNRDYRFVSETLRFLKEEAPALDSPWVQYLGLNCPHPRWVIPERYYRMYPLDNISLPDLPRGWPPELHPVLAATNHYNKFNEAPFPEGNIRRARAAYYGMITMLDEWVGEVLQALEKSGKAGETILVFTADHGEMLGEHGMWFKNTPYDQAARVPLIISGPGFESETIGAPVSHVDLAATILELSGAGPFPGLRGKSLIPLVKGREKGDKRWAYSELNNEGAVTGIFWVRKGPWKYVYFVGFPPLLFNLAMDPGELENLAGSASCRIVEKELKELLYDTVDPEKVSEAAFAHQRRRLDQALSRLDDPQVYLDFERRLGKEFAGKLKETRG